MADQISTTYNVPNEVKEAARLSVGYLIKLLPGWVNHLHIDFPSIVPEEHQGTLAKMQADYKYRKVYLDIHPRWLWESEQHRKEVIVHEAVHVLNAPIQAMVEAGIKALRLPKEAEDLFQAQWTIANESATEDTARAILETAGWGTVELEDVKTEDITEEQPPAERQTEVVKQNPLPEEDV